MVRKAETLNSISELKLSKRTQRLIWMRFGVDTQSIIKEGRDVALHNDMYPEYANKEPKYMQELVNALDKAGFIRHDFYPKTWCIWGFYIAILARVPLAVATINSRQAFISGKEYESMPKVSDEDFKKIMTTLDSLTEEERTILILRYGLDCGTTRNLEVVGKILGVTREHARRLEVKALKKMRNPSCLYKLPALFGFVPQIEPEPEDNLSVDETKVIDINADIYHLNLSVRAYNCLKRSAHINTIEDILNYPQKDWSSIKNLGRKSIMEIQEKMHAAGYPDFCIDALS